METINTPSFYSNKLSSNYIIDFQELLHILRDEPCELLILALGCQRHDLVLFADFHLHQPNVPFLPGFGGLFPVEVHFEAGVLLGGGDGEDAPEPEEFLHVLLGDGVNLVGGDYPGDAGSEYGDVYPY